MEDVFHFARKGRLPIKYGWHLNLKSVRVGSKSLYSTFPHLYHLSSLKNCLVADFFFFLFVYFSFGYYLSLSDREGVDFSSFLALIGELDFRIGRRNVLCL